MQANTSRLAALLFPLVLAAFDAGAADLFDVRVTIGGVTERRGFANAEEALRLVENENVEKLFPDYRETDAVDAAIQFRGLPITVRFAENSRMLMFEVPSLGIERTFDGATRNDSAEQLVDFLKEEGKGLLDRIQRELSRVSPVDPVAGNPASLQSVLVREAFESGGFAPGGARPQNRFGLAVSGGLFKAGDFEGRSITLPLNYAIGLSENDPRMKLRFKLPLTWQEVEGANIYAVAPSVAFTAPVTASWALTPGASWGAVGSIDAASVSHMVGATLTSDYRMADFPSPGATLALTNMAGHVRTLPFAFRGYDFDPGLRNTVLKNGLSFERSTGFALFGDADLIAKLSYAHSWFLGTELFMNQYHELALSLGAPIEALEATGDDIHLGAAWTFGEDYNGVSVHFGYEF